MKELKVGWGEQVITPIGKVVIAGCIPYRVTDKIHDEIKAVAMVLGSNNERSIWVSCDFCHPTKQLMDEVIGMLSEKLSDFKPEQLIINGTHATACFYLSDEEFLDCGRYIENIDSIIPIEEARRQVCDGIVKSVEYAVYHQEAFEMAYASIDILTGFCRMTQYKDGTAQMYGEVNCPNFLKMEFADGGPTQVLYFYEKHNHILKAILANVPCPAQADESSEYITADYWGVVRDEIEKHYGKNVKVLATCRAAGELSPHKLIPNRENEWGREKAEKLGKWIAKNIIDAEKSPCALYTMPHISYRRITEHVNFPLRSVTTEDYVKAKEFLRNDDNFDSHGRCIDWEQEFDAVCKMKLYENSTQAYQAQISVIQLCDIILYTAPVELFSEYARRIEVHYPKYKLFDVQLANDSMGYLPTKEAIERGGYSTACYSTVTDQRGGEVYINKICKMIDRL